MCDAVSKGLCVPTVKCRDKTVQWIVCDNITETVGNYNA